MRTAAVLPAVASLVAAPAAHAGWDPAQATGQRLRPLAATAPGRTFSIWGTNGATTRRLTDPAGSVSPVSFPSDILSGPWLVNRRGDVLMVDRVGRDGALLVEAGGARVRMTMEVPRRQYLLHVESALGEDGSAVVAWTAEGASTGAPETVWVRVRPPGGQFGPRVSLRNDLPVTDVDVDVAPGGRADVVYRVDAGALEKSIVRSEVGPDGLHGQPVTLATGELIPDLEAVTGRVIYHTGTELIALSPAGESQRLGDGDFFSAHRLADGGVLLAYVRGRDVLVRQAAAGAPFGPAQVLARIARGSHTYEFAVASSASATLVAWRESVAGCVRDWCFDRVVSAMATPGGGFGPARLVSPLGTRTNRVVIAVTDDGRRLIAWHAAAVNADAPGALWTVSGDATADAPARADRTRPRLRVLDALMRDGKLRLKLRADERVAVRAFVGDTSRGRAVVLPARRTRTLVWPLSRYQRLQRSALSVAADAAGNARSARVKL